MNLIVDKTVNFFPDKEIFIDSVASNTKHGVVFEIDGETAYFYALQIQHKQQKILDALHIFDVNSIADASKPSIAKIDWSEDSRYAILFLNDYAHAIFDFKEKQGYNRTEFPDKPSQTGWSKKSKKWNEEILNKFKK